MAFRFQPGFISQRTAIALNELAQIVEKLEPLLRRQGESAERTQERFVVKITAVDGSGAYSGTEQGYTTAGAYEDLPNGRVFSPSDKPIYERNGRTLATFPVYYEVSLRQLVGGTPTYEFDAGSADAIIDLSGRTGSVADVTALQILRGVISGTASAAVFTPDDASASLPGLVNLSSQTLGAGVKTITDGMRVGGASNHTDVASDGAITVSTGADNLQITVSSSASTLLANNFAGTPYLALRESLAGYSAGGGVIEAGGNTPTMVCRKFAAGLEYSVLDGGGTLQSGASGTSGGGDTVRGGIILTIGSGPSAIDGGTWT